MDFEFSDQTKFKLVVAFICAIAGAVKFNGSARRNGQEPGDDSSMVFLGCGAAGYFLAEIIVLGLFCYGIFFVIRQINFEEIGKVEPVRHPTVIDVPQSLPAPVVGEPKVVNELQDKLKKRGDRIVAAALSDSPEDVREDEVNYEVDQLLKELSRR